MKIWKKWSLPLKVFLGVLIAGILYVLIASIIRVYTEQIEVRMAVARFIFGSVLTLIGAGVAADITWLTVAFKNKDKKKLNITLIVFLIGVVVAVLYVLIRTVIRVSIGEITSNEATFRFIIGSIIYAVGAGVIAGIAALVLAIKKLGE